ISGNLATNGYGGGVMCYDNAAPVLTNNTISGNGATKVGGGVCAAHDSSPVLSNTTVAFSTMGGGLCVYADAAHPSTLAMSYCDIYGNPEGNYRNWPNQTGKNGNLSKDPLFANAAKGDFHEKSKGGRWNPVTRTWVKDTVQSPCIDKGKPASPFALEPAPNGGRINMGAYGNTAQASKSAPVAPVDGLVLTAAANSVAGGVSQITVTLTSAAAVQVSVLNLAGKEVAVLPTANLSEGVSTLLWSGRATSGTKAPAGRYLVRVTARGEDGGQRQALASLSLAR
ncbi:MAG: FlgD immunoglobulin-like domain containing protein, partial [Armatimonadota bacterium]